MTSTVNPTAPTPLMSYSLNLCLAPSSKTCSPTDNDPLVYVSGGSCKEKYVQFTLGSDGVLTHNCSGKMVCSANGATYSSAKIVVSSACTIENSKFERTSGK